MGANTTILTTDDMAWLMDAATLSSTETAQVSYMINTGEGDVAAIQFTDKSVIQLGALSQKITVNTGQKQGLLVANSDAEIGRLNLTQIHTENKGEAIQLSNDSRLHVKELVLNSNRKGITVDFSTLRIGDVSTSSTVTVSNYTGLNDARIYLNTRLNGDDVTGAGSDKIVVRDGGLMSGTTTFHFANAGGAGAATYDGIQFVEAKGAAIVDKSQMKIAGGYVVAGAYGYVGRQGQYTHSADNQSLFLTNFAPKGATVDGHGFLTGGVGVTPPKSAEVASGNGTGVGGQFSEAPTDGTSTGNRHIDKQGHSVCDNGSTSAGCLLPVTNRAGNAIIYTSELDSTGKTDDVTVTETGEVTPPKPNTNLAKILTKTPNLDSKSKLVSDSNLDSKSGSNAPVVAPIQSAPKLLISPDFVTYNAAADVVSLSANTLLGSYHERMGTQNTPLIQAEKSTSYNPNSWGRLVADTREVAYGNAAFDQSVKGKTTGFQMGHSFWQHRHQWRDWCAKNMVMLR